MIHLFLNGLSASAGGGLTYVRNVVPLLAQCPQVRATVLIPSTLRQELKSLDNVEFPEATSPDSTMRRFWWEQTHIPDLIRRSGADVLLSAGNFALFSSPVPQILLSRNALYTSKDFYQDLLRRQDYSLWLDTNVKGIVAKASVRKADVTIAPSATFAEELIRWTGVRVEAVPHGFDAERFGADPEPLPTGIAQKLVSPQGSLRLLFVSHYNYYRNFETLFRALPLLQKLIPARRVQLVLTCRLSSGQNPGSYQADSAAVLVEKLGIAENVLELGEIRYPLLHHVYRVCDIYVTAAYSESFAHPLVEAMWSLLPVVAADLPVHREICGDAALYFPRFSSEALAETIAKLSCDPAGMNLLRERGSRRATDFSWAKHVDELLRISRSLIA